MDVGVPEAGGDDAVVARDDGGADGNVDVRTDGSDQAILLAGTGKENESTTAD